MNILKDEYIIASSFLAEPWKKLTYNDIRKISGKKSKGYIYKSISKLLAESIIISEQVGKSLLYSINLGLMKARSYLGMVQEQISWNQKHIPQKLIEKISRKISTKFFIFIVTGSYAKKTQTKQSDLDIMIVCDDSIDPKSIMAQIKHESETSIPEVHPFVFTKSQMKEMLLEEGENYGKEATRHNFIFNGASQYYNIIGEAIKNGYRG